MACSHNGQPRILLYNSNEHMNAISMINILIHDIVHRLHGGPKLELYVYIYISQ